MKKWLISGVAFCMVFGLTGCDSKESKTTEKVENVSSSNATNQKQEEAKNVYKIGDTIKVKNNNGEYTFKITSVKSTSERNQFSEKKANDVILIDFEYENISLNEELYISDFDFSIYDKNNNACETYPVGELTSQSVSIGRKGKGQYAYAINDGNKYAELEYKDNMFDNNYTFKVILEW